MTTAETISLVALFVSVISLWYARKALRVSSVPTLVRTLNPHKTAKTKTGTGENGERLSWDYSYHVFTIKIHNMSSNTAVADMSVRLTIRPARRWQSKPIVFYQTAEFEWLKILPQKELLFTTQTPKTLSLEEFLCKHFPETMQEIQETPGYKLPKPSVFWLDFETAYTAQYPDAKPTKEVKRYKIELSSIQHEKTKTDVIRIRVTPTG